MATVVLCDKCNKQIYGTPHVIPLSETMHCLARNADFCDRCWKQLSLLIWEKIGEKYNEDGTDRGM